MQRNANRYGLSNGTLSHLSLFLSLCLCLSVHLSLSLSHSHTHTHTGAAKTTYHKLSTFKYTHVLSHSQEVGSPVPFSLGQSQNAGNAALLPEAGRLCFPTLSIFGSCSCWIMMASSILKTRKVILLQSSHHLYFQSKLPVFPLKWMSLITFRSHVDNPGSLHISGSFVTSSEPLSPYKGCKDSSSSCRD